MPNGPEPHPSLLTVGSDGTPNGVVDVEKVLLDAHAVALELTAASHDPNAFDAILRRLRDCVGTEALPFVLLTALRWIVLEPLNTAIEIVDHATTLKMRTSLQTAATSARKRVT